MARTIGRIKSVTKRAKQNTANRKAKKEYMKNRGSYIPDNHPDVKKRIDLKSSRPLKKQIRSAKRRVDSRINRKARKLTRTQGST